MAIGPSIIQCIVPASPGIFIEPTLERRKRNILQGHGVQHAAGFDVRWHPAAFAQELPQYFKIGLIIDEQPAGPRAGGRDFSQPIAEAPCQHVEGCIRIGRMQVQPRQHLSADESGTRAVREVADDAVETAPIVRHGTDRDQARVGQRRELGVDVKVHLSECFLNKGRENFLEFQ